MLGIVAILLTAIGSYRFSAYFMDDGVFPFLIAVGATMSFLILFPYILFITGVGIILLPIGVILKKGDIRPNIFQQSGKSKNFVNNIISNIQNRMKSENQVVSNSPNGKIDAYSSVDDDQAITCPNCEERIEDGTAKFCGYCGEEIEDL